MEITVELDFDAGEFLIVNAQSASWGITHAGSGGTPSGEASPQDLVFTASSSPQSTPQLKSACESGALLKRVTVSMVDPGGGVGLKWVLDIAFLSSFQTGGSTAEAFPVDSVSISFQTITVEPF
jgi:type VI protein secretion system component Hcp